MNLLRRSSNTVSSLVTGTVSTAGSVVSGTVGTVGGVIRRASLMGSDSRVKVNECDDEEILRSAKDRVTLILKCTPGKDAAITSALALKRMFIMKRNEQGVYNKKLVCTVPHMFLYYFDSELSEQPRGIIDLYYYTDMSVEGDGNILKISAPDETGLKSYFFRIDDPTMLSELINSLHRDRYNVVRDERDAYQALQDQFSGEMETSSKQLVSSGREMETVKREMDEQRKRADDACEAVQNAILKFQVSDAETNSLTAISQFGDLLNGKIDELNSRLQITIDDYDKVGIALRVCNDSRMLLIYCVHLQQLISERQQFNAQIQELEAQLQAEAAARKQVETVLVHEKKELEFRLRESLGDIDRLNLNFQAAVTSRDVAEEKANTLGEQKKVLVKEVKTLRKKMETTQQDYDTIKAMNEELAKVAEPLQQQNVQLTNKLVDALAALKEAQAQLVMIQDANNAAEMAEEAAIKAAAAAQAAVSEISSTVAEGGDLLKKDIAGLRFEQIYKDKEHAEDAGAGNDAGASSDSRRGSHNAGNASDELSWLSPEQRQHLFPGGSAPAGALTGDAVRRPSALGGIFAAYDKLVAKPILGDSDASHAAPPASNPPADGKIYCLRCGGTVEGPKYSTCKCAMPALNQEMLQGDVDSGSGHSHAGQPSGGGAMSRVGNVGSSLFGALRRASTVAGSAAVMAASAASSVAVSSVAAGSRAANPSSVLDPTSTGINASNSSHNILSSTLGGSSTPVKTQLLDLDDDPILASSPSPSYASPTAGHGSPGSSGSGGLLNVNESGTSTVSSDIDGSGSGSSNAIV
jgi:uncharacterized coiled-coil DUF342 family protein